MKRRLALLVLVPLLALTAPAPPAAAHEDACVATGTMTLSTGFGLAFTSNTASFTMSFTVGACVTGIGQFWSGTITGACGLASGSGVTSSGHTFSFTVTADTMTLTGELVGTVEWNEDPMDSGSCVNKTAQNFLTTGTWAEVGSGSWPPNYPPYTPTQLAPAASHEFAPTGTQTFSIETTDPEGDNYAGRIEVRTAGGQTVATYYTAPASSGSTVSVTGPPLPSGSYEWAAAATDDTTTAPAGTYSPPSPWSPFTVAEVPTGTGGPNDPPAAPTLLSPLAGHQFAGTATPAFTIQAVDPDGDSYVGRIRVRSGGITVATYFTAPTPSGANATATGSPLPGGLYEWSADATDNAHAATATFGPASAWRPFTVQNVPTPADGTGFPSDDCVGGAVLTDTFAGSTYTRIHSKQPDPSTTWVCYRTEGAGVTLGGKLVVTSPGATSPGVPSTDANAGVCASRPGNLVPGPHPTLAGSVGDPADPSTYVPFFADVHATTSAATLCLSVGTTGRQVTVPVPQAGTPPSVTMFSDEAGVHRPSSPVNSAPVSGACQAATTGVRSEYVNSTGASGQVWLHTWEETPTRTHVCVRMAGVTTAGGRLTVDTTGVPGATPYLTTSTTDTAACALRVAGIDSPTTVELRRSTSVTDPSGVSFCVVVGGTKVRVTTGVAGSATPPQATWTPDP